MKFKVGKKYRHSILGEAIFTKECESMMKHKSSMDSVFMEIKKEIKEVSATLIR